SAASTSSRSAARPTNDVRATGRPTTPPGGGASPASGPTSAASSLRSATPYLRSSDETWPSTVRTDRCRRRAIWALDSCAPTAASTSASRPVTSTGWGTGPSWPNSRWRWPPPALVTGGHRGLPRSGAGPRAVHHGLHDPDDEGAPMTVPSLPKSAELNARLHAVVPGGAHTYAKGDDQYPQDLAPIISHGRGAHVWDVDGNQYIEYGSGRRAVSLGHAHPRILDAVRRELDTGSNFVRPAAIEATAAERFLATIPTAETGKFTKNDSDATTAAGRRARADPSRAAMALHPDHPFFATHEWFIATPAMNARIPTLDALTFPYANPHDLEAAPTHHLFAAVIMEPATPTEPPRGYLQG